MMIYVDEKEMMNLYIAFVGEEEMMNLYKAFIGEEEMMNLLPNLLPFVYYRYVPITSWLVLPFHLIKVSCIPTT